MPPASLICRRIALSGNATLTKTRRSFILRGGSDVQGHSSRQEGKPTVWPAVPFFRERSEIYEAGCSTVQPERSVSKVEGRKLSAWSFFDSAAAAATLRTNGYESQQ